MILLRTTQSGLSLKETESQAPMLFYNIAKNALKILDRFSPYPILHPFVMSNEEMRVFDEEIKDAKYYLEFGLGGSTIRAIQRSKAIIHTVESSTDWVKEMRRYLLVRQHEKRRLRIFSVDIGPVLEWGYPKSDNFKNSFETYSSGIFQSIDCSQIDLILVDGRFRVACTLKSILECQVNSSVKILIHDFWNRPQYHTVLQYLDIVKKVDTIGLFSIKNGIDRESLLRDYEVYKLIPE